MKNQCTNTGLSSDNCSLAGDLAVIMSSTGQRRMKWCWYETKWLPLIGSNKHLLCQAYICDFKFDIFKVLLH